MRLDGPQEALCSREKTLRTFYGVVSLSDTGRVVSGGYCDSCLPLRHTYMEVALYTP